MHVLEFDKFGFPKYWIDENDPLHGFSLWKRLDGNTSMLVKNIPPRFKKQFKNIKDVYLTISIEQ